MSNLACLTFLLVFDSFSIRHKSWRANWGSSSSSASSFGLSLVQLVFSLVLQCLKFYHSILHFYLSMKILRLPGTSIPGTLNSLLGIPNFCFFTCSLNYTKKYDGAQRVKRNDRTLNDSAVGSPAEVQFGRTTIQKWYNDQNAHFIFITFGLNSDLDAVHHNHSTMSWVSPHRNATLNLKLP